MRKLTKTILIISIAVFGAGFLLINSVQAGVIQFGDKNIFVNFNELPFNLDNFAPGVSTQKTITITNNEDFDIDVFLKASRNEPFPQGGEADLADVLTLTVGEQSKHISELFNESMEISSINSGEPQDYQLNISFDEDAGNEYQNKTINFDFIITAEQIGKGNGEIPQVVIPGGGGGGGGLPLGLMIFNEADKDTSTTSVTITWQTNYFSTSQVIYGAASEAHTLDLSDNTGNPPKYGYEHTTPEYDTGPNKVTYHTVVITGLTPATTYYYRCVSHGSLAVSSGHTFTTKGIAGEETYTKENKGNVFQQNQGITQENKNISFKKEGGERGGVSEKEGITNKIETFEKGNEKELKGFDKLLAAIGMFFNSKGLCWIFFLSIIIIGILFLLSRTKRETRESSNWWNKWWVFPVLVTVLIILYYFFCCSYYQVLILITLILFVIFLLLKGKKRY